MRLLSLVAFLSLIAFSAGVARADREKGGTEMQSLQANTLYAKECGSCHMAYQPQYLPKRSWVKVMDTLDNHFGENASLDEAVRTQIRDYLSANSAETSNSKRPRKFLSSIRDADTPLRISDTPYFKKKHDKVRPEVFKRKSILSPANCVACHPAAEKGDFDDDRVKIPKD